MNKAELIKAYMDDFGMTREQAVKAVEKAEECFAAPRKEEETKYYKANDVIKVLLDNGYGDEENGADPEYMTALHDVYRGLDNIPVYAITKKEEARYNADMLKAFNAGIEFAEKEKEKDLDHYTKVKEWAKNNGFVLVTEEWYDKARVAYYWRYYGKRSESR